MERILPALDCMLFDLDGVILDSEPVHERVRIRLFLEYSRGRFSAPPYDPVGMSTDDIFRYLAALCDLPDDPVAMTRRHFDETLAEIRRCHIPPSAGFLPLLDALWAARVPCAVVSSSAQVYVEGVLSHFGVLDRFQTIVTGDDVSRLKPDPEPYRTALHRLGVDPARVCTVEDSRVGVASTLAAGIHVIGYRNPTSGAQDLSGADACVGRLSEVAALIGL